MGRDTSSPSFPIIPISCVPYLSLLPCFPPSPFLPTQARRCRFLSTNVLFFVFSSRLNRKQWEKGYAVVPIRVKQKTKAKTEPKVPRQSKSIGAGSVARRATKASLQSESQRKGVSSGLSTVVRHRMKAKGGEVILRLNFTRLESHIRLCLTFELAVVGCASATIESDEHTSLFLFLRPEDWIRQNEQFIQ